MSVNNRYIRCIWGIVECQPGFVTVASLHLPHCDRRELFAQVCVPGVAEVLVDQIENIENRVDGGMDFIGHQQRSLVDLLMIQKSQWPTTGWIFIPKTCRKQWPKLTIQPQLVSWCRISGCHQRLFLVRPYLTAMRHAWVSSLAEPSLGKASGAEAEVFRSNMQHGQDIMGT